MNKALLVSALLLAAAGVRAQTTCGLVSAGTLAFGTYDVLSVTHNDSQVSIVVSCNRRGGRANVDVTMGLGTGTHGTDVAARRLGHTTVPGDYLEYGLFRDVSRTAVWGSTAGVNAVTQSVFVPNRGSESLAFTIYGRIRAQQLDARAGSYADSVQITVTP